MDCRVLCPYTRLLCPWSSLDKNTGVGCHALLQGIFVTQGSNPQFLCLLHCRRILCHCVTGKPFSWSDHPKGVRLPAKGEEAIEGSLRALFLCFFHFVGGDKKPINIEVDGAS